MGNAYNSGLNDATVKIVGCGVVSSVVLFLFIRHKSKMSSLLTWIFGSFRTQQCISSDDDKNKSKDKTQLDKNKIQSKVVKVRQRAKKSNEDPAFSTSLVTPIEDILEETINEVSKPNTSKQSINTRKEKSTKTISKDDEIKSKKASNQQDLTDNIGYSFFNVKSFNRDGSTIKEVKSEAVNLNEEPDLDDIGFSFLPVRERGKKYKQTKNSELKEEQLTLNSVLENTTRKAKKDLSKSSIIDHYQSNRGQTNQKRLEAKEFSNTVKKSVNVLSNSLHNKPLFENCYQTELKESKKVSSSVSYASVVVNNVQNLSPQIEPLNYIEKIETKLPQVKSEHSNQSVSTQISSLGLELSQSLSDCSNSSSIEVINENSNSQKVEDSSTFEFIEGKLHVSQEQEIENFLIENLSDKQSSSKHSSISVIDNQIELEEISNIPLDTNESDVPLIDVRFNTDFENSDNIEKNIVNGNTVESSTDSSLFVSFEKDLDCQVAHETEVKTFKSLYQYNSQDSDIYTERSSLEQDYLNENTEVSRIFPKEITVDFLQPLETTKEASAGSISEEQLEKVAQELELQIETTITGKEEPSIKHITSQFLEEEKCTKKFAYVLGSDTNHKNFDKEPSFSSVLDQQISSENNDFLTETAVKTESTSQTNLIDKQVSHITQEFVSFQEKSDISDQISLRNGFEEILSEDTSQESPKLTEYSEEIKETIVEEDFGDVQMNLDKMQQIRVLTLNDQEHQECTLFRIEKNWIIQFRIGPSLFGRKIFLYCNYPIKSENKFKEFRRDQYQLLDWISDEGCENADDTAIYTQIRTEMAGSFHYYFTYENGETLERQCSGYFLVDPVLKYGNNEDLPLDCIQCQTVLAKSLGSFSTWEGKLRVSKESGYNLIHFTPIQELGASNSSYSLSEQLSLNPVFKKSNGLMPTFKEIEEFVSKMRTEWKVGSICDIVLNHTANESKWIQDHPEVTYNCLNCPYMRPAYLLDAALDCFASDVKKGLYEDRGILPEINHEDHLNAIRYHFRVSVLVPLKIHELFICDGNKLVDEFLKLARTGTPLKSNSTNEELKLIQDPEYKRLSCTIDMKLALKLYNVYWNDTFDEDSRLKKCSEQFKKRLDSLNDAVMDNITDHLNAAIDNVLAGIRYYRVQKDGPKFKDITVKTPLVYRYFTDYGTPKTLKEYEEIMYSDKGRFLMAHNGWVMSSDPLRNFAAQDSKVYLRRELIAWGDSVKLRFGDKPEDCPFLWEHMRKYVEQTARIFDGVRLDNCHSTPLPVAEYLLDCARRVRPDLYVVAELFTNSDMTDNIFVNRLGITSLIREALNAWDSHEEGRLVYRFGGSPVGSFYQPNIRPLVPSIAHALFLDQTHDNPSPVEKRSVFDLLPTTALVNMACCASGSNRGYDELVPHHIHVVDEDREYPEWTEDEGLVFGNLRYVFNKSGIISAKKALNDLHFHLGKEGFSQVYVDQMDPDIVAVTRHCPVTHQSYILVAFTAFNHPNEDSGSHQRGIKPLRFEGVLDEIVLEASLSHVSHKNGGSKFVKSYKYIKDSKWINGLSEYQVSTKQHIQIQQSDVFEKVDSGTPNVTQLNFKDFKPGSIVIVKASLPENMSAAIKTIRKIITNISPTKETELLKIVNKMRLSDMNRALYRCDQEERDEGFGFDTYNIPNFGSVVYAGLQGIMSLLAKIRPNNDLGHPLCANLRDGNWLIDFIWKRLKLDPGTQQLGEWLELNTKTFDSIPRYLVPCYFDMIVTGVYIVLLESCHNLMSNFIKNGSTFVRGLALGSVQCGAYIKSADLPTLSPNLVPPKPPVRKVDNEVKQACVTLSAGLPHFAVGYMRNWGRDTFIALRGLFILTGRYQESREHILGYAACLRHGLIPNLLDGGRNARFNCRDAIWWWLYCIKEYVSEAPDGIKILSDKVSRIFPTDDADQHPPGAVDQPLHDVIQEAMKVHFQGLAFRERNAGRQIDEHMTDYGFNNQIGVHPETGFIFGGNKWNCGTWMDKMGSSDKAGNRGKPASPRDGSAVELVGLSKSVISWLAKLHDENKYPYKGVERVHKTGTITRWTYKEWAQKIQHHFEKYFWINSKPVESEIRPDLINVRGIYKDCYGSSLDYTDFQLRCNFPIAMVAAPELFSPSHTWEALNQAEKHLLGPLGMKTLAPGDWAYRGDYDNSNQSDDPTVAHGFNYHQGPEWVWPVGFFLRARLLFAAQNGALPETVAHTKLVLSKHFVELQTSDWRGLPELTNSNGAYCSDSSRTQAWSMSCILEVLYDLQKIESELGVAAN